MSVKTSLAICRWRRGLAGGPQGFSLLELMLAVSLLGLGLLMLGASLPVGVRFFERGRDDARAMILASTTVDLLRLPKSFSGGYRQDGNWSNSSSPSYSSSITNLYRVPQRRVPAAVMECFIETDSVTGPLMLGNPSRTFEARFVQYLHDHDGTAAGGANGGYSLYLPLHRRARNRLNDPNPAVRAWAKANERVAAAMEVSFYPGTTVANGYTGNASISEPNDNGDREGMFPPLTTPAVGFQTVVPTLADKVDQMNHIFLWMPWTDRIDTSDVIIDGTDSNNVVGGRYVSHVFYRRLNINGDLDGQGLPLIDERDLPAMYEVLVAVQRHPTERRFRLFHKTTEGQPAWAVASNTNWRVEGWALRRAVPVAGRVAIDDLYRLVDTDSTIEVMNEFEQMVARPDLGFGRIRLHTASIVGDRVTVSGSLTDPSGTTFDARVNPQVGAYLIDYYTGQPHVVIARESAASPTVRVAPLPVSLPGVQPRFWAVPSCIAIHKAVMRKRLQ